MPRSQATSAIGLPVSSTIWTASALNCGLNLRRCSGMDRSSQQRVTVQDRWYTPGMARRQVFDIPKIAVGVAEHRLVSRRCACGTVTAATAPAGVSAPVQYGPHAAAIAVYLCLGQHLPVERVAGLRAG